MSGRKTISVDVRDFERMQAAQSRLRSVHSDVDSLIAGVRRESQREFQQRLAPLEERQREFTQSLSNMSQTMRNLERETASRFERQSKEFGARLQASEESLRGELYTSHNELLDALSEQGDRLDARIDQERAARKRQLASMRSEFDTRMSEERAVRQGQFEHLDGQLKSIATNEARKAEIAQSVIADAKLLVAEIQKGYSHKAFAPGKLDDHAMTLSQATSNLELRLSDPAITFAQTAYRGLSELRMELELREREWEWTRSAALSTAKEILELARANRKCALEVEGSDERLEHEVDYWSGGALAALENELGTTLETLASATHETSLDTLRNQLQETLPDYRRRLAQVVDCAKRQIISSQVRINLAQLAAQALIPQGYKLDDRTYAGKDMRAEYIAKLKHQDGGEVVIKVEPVPGSPGSNQIKIISFDGASVTDAERRVRAAELRQSLAETGLEVGSPQEDTGAPDPADQDMEAARQRQPSLAHLTDS